MGARWRNAALAPLVLSVTGCSHRTLEPPRAIPETWQVWSGGNIRLRFPEDCEVVKRGVDTEEMSLLIMRRSNPNKLILCLKAGNNLAFPTLKGLQGAQIRQIPTRLGQLNAERLGPALLGERYSSEVLLDLGSKRKFTQLHASYAQLEPDEQTLAETILASIQPL